MIKEGRLKAFNLAGMDRRASALLKPPVGNQLVWSDPDMMVTIVGWSQ